MRMSEHIRRPQGISPYFQRTIDLAKTKQDAAERDFVCTSVLCPNW